MRRTRGTLCLASAAALLVCAAGGQAQVPDTAGLGRRVDALAARLLARPVAGISVAVARDGRLLLARGYGMANLEHSVSVTPQTVFHIASISKYILAAAALQLTDEGRLDLDADVTRYVPEAPTRGRTITMRQLLRHTSGIFSFTSLPDADANERLDLTHEQVLALIRDHPPDFEPGTSWRYDNAAFYLAGMVVERVTGQDYGTYVRRRLFQPLGMHATQLCDAHMVVPHLASGYDREQGAFVNPGFAWKIPFAAGGICATASDLVRWQEALDAGRVLSAASLRSMRTRTTLPDGSVIEYGEGTRLGSLEGHRVLGHTGSGGGFAAALVVYPDDRLTVVVLVNTGVGATPPLTLATAIARPLLGLPDRRTPADLPLTERELAALTGSYDSDDGPVELFGSGGRLHFRAGRDEGVLRRQPGDVFLLDDDTEVRFLVRGGVAQWCIVRTGGLLMDAKRRVR